MSAYYNEMDPNAAAWLRELIKAGMIAPGFVDERDIRDVRPDELLGYTQCHFFAGIGVWSYALRQAWWPDDRPIWTGSCPCQPFSAAGRGACFTDERHLWPHWFHLITQCQPDRVLGEQVASKDGLAWLDLVQADLEAADYASGAVDLCAAGVGAPHIRQRLFFVAERVGHTCGQGLSERVGDRGFQPEARRPSKGQAPDLRGDTGGLADSEREQRQKCVSGPRESHKTETGGATIELTGFCSPDNVEPCPTNGLWADADWLSCRDGKWRPVEPGTFPLANGAPARVGRLRGYGNAINAEAARIFIESALDL